MEERDPTCEGKAEDHYEKIEKFEGFNQKLSSIDHVSNVLTV